MQYSAIAVIVKKGFTPIVPGISDPSVTYKLLYPFTLPKLSVALFKTIPPSG